MRMIRRTGWGQPRGIRSGVLWLGLLAWLLVTTAVPAAERVTYLHTDVLGSVVAASDANGQLLWREQYEPYGERIRRENDDAQGQWYTGHLQDADVGLDYMGSRWYDPTLGRFMAIDPVDIAAADVNRFNRYAYANNNPYLYADPDGELPIIAVGLFALDFYSAYKETGSVGDAAGIAALGIINPFKKIKTVSNMVSGAGKLGKASKKTTQSDIGVTRHSVQQKINREVRSADELDAIKNPLDVRPVKIDHLGRPSQRSIGRKAEVARNPETGDIVSVNPTSKRKAERLLNRQRGQR
jgi:RHS repeat-associated protein